MHVFDGNKHFHKSLYTYWNENLRLKAIHAGHVIPAPVQPDVDLKINLQARVCHNMWIVDCPWCNGAEFVWLDTPLFMCSNCMNMSIDTVWLPVQVPLNYEEIETILMQRPVPQNRNWYPQETVEDLIKENKEHGIN